MTQTTPPSLASTAFQSITVIYLAFLGAIFMYFAVGEIMWARVEDFANEGFVGLDDTTIWLLRGAFIALALTNIALARTLFSDEPTVTRTIAKKAPVDDTAVVTALMSAGIVRLAFIEAIAIYGLVLFESNAERFDLYGFGLVAIANLLFVRPSREHWNATFGRLALEHPGVTSMPL